MRNFDTKAITDINDEARRSGITQAESFDEPTFLQVHNAFDTFMLNEARSDSEQKLMESDVTEALETYARVRPDVRPLMEPELISPGVFEPMYYKNKALLQALEQDILDDRAKFPDAGLVSLSDILGRTAEKTKADRENAMKLMANARGFAKAGILTGSATGVITDPLILATLPIGAGTITGAGIAGNAAKAFGVEALIAGVSESLIQPQVYNWKKQINSPYSAGEAAFNIMTAMVAAGAIRATGSALVDIVEIRSAAKLKRAEGGKLAEQEADILEQHADDLAAADGDVQGHFDALDQAINDFDQGKSSTAGRVVEHVEAVDPLSVHIDAETFQFKTGADVEGVTERLKGVERWDPKLAGIAIIYENKQNKRFVVDGHQRISLAKRMIEKGQDPAEVNLNAIVLRETDGVSIPDARQIAAVKNIAEGTGSAVDAAKIFRELGVSGLDLMPSLPPTSALVKAGRGLSQLDDEAFRMVAAGVVDEKYGALVGELVVKADEQKAIITALSQAEPANLVQARIMINDLRAAGFQRVETQDLFGGQEITESLLKERARILDNSLKRLRQDKATFKTLESKAGEIAGEGNILVREANLARISEDEKAIANLTALANTKGPISEALNEASSELKQGANIKQVTDDFLGAVRSTDAVERDAGAGISRPGRDGEGVEFKKGTPVKTEEIDLDQVESVTKDFISSQKGRSIEETYKTASKNQGQLTRAGNQIMKDLSDDNVLYINPGIKKRATAEGKIERKGYADAGGMTDIIRGGFAVRTPADADAIVDAMGKKFAILDEGWNRYDGGYIDRKVLIRFNDGSVGEIQLWEPHLFVAKEDGIAAKVLPKKWLDENQQVPEFKDSGHAVFEDRRALEVERKVPVEKMGEYEALGAKMENEVYEPAIRLANKDWKTLIDTRRPDSVISAGEAADQLPGGPSVGIKKPTKAPLSEAIKAGRFSQLNQDLTSDVKTGVSMTESIAEREVITTDLLGDDVVGAQAMHDARMAVNARLNPDDAVPVGAGEGDLFSGRANQLEIEDAIDRQIYENDLDIPVGLKVDEEGKTVAVTRTAREVYDDIDNQAKAIADLEGCLVG